MYPCDHDWRIIPFKNWGGHDYVKGCSTLQADPQALVSIVHLLQRSSLVDRATDSGSCGQVTETFFQYFAHMKS